MNPDREAQASALRARIGVDANAAVEALMMIAESLEAGEMPPKPLATYLASAIERAMNERSRDRDNVLLCELGLTAPAKPGAKKIHVATGPIALAMAVKSDTMSDQQIAKRLAGMVGTAPNTVRARMKDVAVTIAEGRAMFAAVMPVRASKRSVY